MALSLVTAPAVEPITTAEAKAHLRVDSSDEDTRIGSLVTVAREYCEKVQQRAFVTQTWDLTLDEFPEDGKSCIQIPYPPLQSITSVTYLAADGASTAWDSANYVVDTKNQPGKIALAPDALWPTTESGRINAVTIRFVAGYGAAAAVPERVKQAIYLLVGHWYANRESVVNGTISTELVMVDALLGLDRVGGWF